MKIQAIEITAVYKGYEWCVSWRSNRTASISWVNNETFEHGTVEWTTHRFVGNKSMAMTRIRRVYKEFILPNL